MKKFIKRNLFAFIMNIVNVLMFLQFVWRNTLTLTFIPLLIDGVALYAIRDVMKESDERKQYIVSYILFLLATAGAGILCLLWFFIFGVKILNGFFGR